MPILAVGGEAETFDLPAGHNYAVSTNIIHYDSVLSRCAMQITTGTSELERPFATGAGISTVYIAFLLYQEAVSLANYIDIYDVAGTQVQYRIVMNADATWKFQRFNGTIFVDLGTTSAPMALNEAITVNIKIIRDAVIGEVSISRNNVQLLNLTGIDTSTPATMGKMRLIGLAGGAERMMVSQLMFADEALANWKLQTLAPQSNGTFTSWTGDFTAIDEVAYNAADFIETNTLNQLETYNVTDIPPAFSTYNVKAVVVAARVSNDAGSAVNDSQFALRTNGNTYTSANIGITKDGSEQSKQTVFNTNPATTNPWTQTEVNAIETGIKSV